MHLLAKMLWFAVVASVLSACSGDDGGSVSATRTGRFVDSAVEGITYATASQQGTTNANGEFIYVAGEFITFSIGDIELPSIYAAPLITPLQVFDTDDTMALEVQNLSRLLQTLDEDGNPDNGIRISASAAASATGLNLDFSSAEFDTDVTNLVANSGSVNTMLVSAADANAHLMETLEANGLAGSDCGSDHPAVGRTAQFQTIFHDVAGTLTVIDNCTIEITNFNYDGQGPEVFFYAAQNRAYESGDVFIIGPQLNGQVYVNDTFRLTIPQGQSLDTFDSVSVWCVDFKINFGDAFLGALSI